MGRCGPGVDQYTDPTSRRPRRLAHIPLLLSELASSPSAVIEISPVLYTKPSIEAVTHHLLTVGPQVGYLPSGGLIFPVSGDFSATYLKGWF